MSMDPEHKAALKELMSAWQEFRETNDKRLAAIEKGKGGGEYETKLRDLEVRFSKIEAMAKRPGVPIAPSDGRHTLKDSYQGRAVLAYLRLGREFMPVEEFKTLVLADNPQAGFLAPVEYANEIIKGVTDASPIRSVARVRQTSSRSIQIPKRTGQFAAVWVSESGTRSETEGLTYGLEEIPTHEQYGLVDISNAMLEDSAFNLESELSTEFIEQFAVAEGAAFVNGSAVGRPEGFMTAAGVASTNSGSAATIADANGQANGLISLQHAIKADYARNAVWVLSRATLGSVRRLKDGNNNYIWQPGTSLGNPNTVLGHPYVEATDMPAEGASNFPIAFGDFRRAYTIVDRISFALLRDPFTQQTTGRTRFHARRRVGGQVVLAEAIRKLKCAV